MFIHVLSNPISVTNFRKIDMTDIVIVAGPFLGEMYQLKFGAKPIVAKKTLGAAVYLFFIMLSKINRSIKFIVYHEANNFYFDLFWVILRPKVKRTEYYSLDNFEKTTFEEIPNNKYKKLLKLFGLNQNYDFYFSYDDFGCKKIVWYRVKDKMCLSSNRLLGNQVFESASKSASKNKVLIVSGTDVISNHVLKSTIKSITNLLTDKGYSWSIKDHPNPTFRLWDDHISSDIDAANFIDPLRSSEEFISDFYYAIGFGSTGILNFGQPICVLNFVSQSVEVHWKRDYLVEQARLQNKHISFPKNIEELQIILS